jgi:hypothetical protein
MLNEGTLGSGDCEFSPSLLCMKEDGDAVRAMWAAALQEGDRISFPVRGE